MITVDIAAIRAAIKSNLSAISGLERYDFEPKTPHRPCAIVSWPDTLDPRATFDGSVDMTIPVRFEVEWLGDESADQALMDLMEAAVNAIESDTDLGSTADSIACGPFTDIGNRVEPDNRVIMTFTIPVAVYR
jgi:hypothetical protein